MSSKLKLIKRNIFTTSFALMSALTITGCTNKYDGNSNQIISTEDIVYENTDEIYNDIDNLYVIKAQDENSTNFYIVKKIRCNDIDTNTVDEVTFGSEYIKNRWKNIFTNKYTLYEINNFAYLYVDIINNNVVTTNLNKTDDIIDVEESFGSQILEETKLNDYYNLNQKSYTVDELKELLNQIKIDNKSKVYTK